MRNNRKGIGFGIFLLTVGIIWLLSMYKVVTWNTFNAMITLWPLILVAIGIGFIFRNNSIVRTITWLGLLAVIICYGYFAPANNTWFKYDLHFGDDADHTSSTSNISMDKKPQNEKAELELSYGAMQLNIDSNTSKLLEATINGAKVRQTHDLDGKTAVIKLDVPDENVIHLNGIDKLRSDHHLSKDVVWDLSLDTGAIDGNLDLSGLKVEKLDISTGATALNLKMGSYNTVMNVDSGASKIDITLPKDTGMKARVDGGLNDTNLEGNGWEKKGDWYYSPDYDGKTYKIEATIDSGLGKLTVENSND